MRPQLYTCALVDGTGSVVHIARITADDPIDAGRHASFLASALGGDVSVEMRRADEAEQYSGYDA